MSGEAVYEYERDGTAIYRQSFATIRAEAALERFDPDVATATRTGCEPGAAPWCEAGTRLTADSTVCQFGVEPSPDATGTVTATLYGRLDCEQATDERCADAVAAIAAAPASGATLELPSGSDDDG